MEHITLSEYSAENRKILLTIAKNSISHGLQQHQPLQIAISNYPAQLQQHRACFVTLHLLGALRGCIGSLQANQPLILDVAANAFNAAFRDPRFSPVTPVEAPRLAMDISVLSQPQPMHFSSEANLLQQIRPGIDGLILSERGHRGTFLPTVWEELPDPADFLNNLKSKAGLPTNYWSDTLTVENYTTELIA